MEASLLFKTLELKEHTLYEVKVKTTPNNLEHNSFLFTGFKNGAYCIVYNNNYEHPIDMHKCHKIEVVKEISTIKNL